MNARIIKESRALLPVFAVTILAAVAPPLIWSRETALGVGTVVFTICCLLMGASCFGNEFQFRTMPLLLSQPVTRRSIWNEKMLVLGIGLLIGTTAFLFSIRPDEDGFWFSVFALFCVLCTAPFAALSVKNTLAAAAVTFLLPWALAGLLFYLAFLLSRFFPEAGASLDRIITHHQDLLAIPAVIYCGVIYRLGYRHFIKLQAIDSQAREVALPERLEAFLGRRLKGVLPKYSGPWSSLMRKELRLQKTSFLLAGAMIIGALLFGVIWDVYSNDVVVGLSGVPIAILVLAIPLITPAICVAEERNWGVNGWQGALPVSSRKQWAAKLWTVVLTCVLLGIAVPIMIWLLDGWVFGLPLGEKSFRLGSVAENLLVLTRIGSVYLLLLSLGIFASSVCTHAVKAVIMSIALLGIMASLVFYFSSLTDTITNHYGFNFARLNTGSGELFGLLPLALSYGSVFVGLIVLINRLAFANYQKGEPDSRRVWLQAALVEAALFIGLMVLAPSLYWFFLAVFFGR